MVGGAGGTQALPHQHDGVKAHATAWDGYLQQALCMCIACMCIACIRRMGMPTCISPQANACCTSWEGYSNSLYANKHFAML